MDKIIEDNVQNYRTYRRKHGETLHDYKGFLEHDTKNRPQ